MQRWWSWWWWSYEAKVVMPANPLQQLFHYPSSIWRSETWWVASLFRTGTHANTNVRYGPPPHRDGARGDIGFLNFHMLFQDGSYALFRKGKEVRITNCDSRYMKDRNWTDFFSMATTSRNQWAPKISTFARQVQLGGLGLHLGSTRRSRSTSKLN